MGRDWQYDVSPAMTTGEMCGIVFFIILAIVGYILYRASTG